uniref:CSON001460 protein n=1 Tax=Culicoides sonorensis TaxID=179676 RepID=A0A336L7I1_CULSO
MNIISFKFIFFLVCLGLTWNLSVCDETNDEASHSLDFHKDLPHYVKNRRYGEFLYASDKYYDSSRRRVFTWESTSGHPCHQYKDRPEIDGLDPEVRRKFKQREEEDRYELKHPCLWEFDQVEGQNNTFKMYASFTTSDFQDVREYFYAGADDLKFDRQRRQPFTWTQGACDGPACEWLIEPVYEDENHNKFYTIKNLKFGEYLYAAEDKLKYSESSPYRYMYLGRRKRDLRSPQRRVFTWKYANDNDVHTDDTAHWLIKMSVVINNNH